MNQTGEMLRTSSIPSTAQAERILAVLCLTIFYSHGVPHEISRPPWHVVWLVGRVHGPNEHAAPPFRDVRRLSRESRLLALT